ncbi:alpha/beta-hydrolase [Fragilariopsis cylindrus CCMP1102]|uniref:Alpha/beta-hydrolase n=1 Tax=Fragilariopsis cylindrus CCMP1102 TaxID=635003 RepID=A0A1E7F3J4_9STRA|nr:alpha/beta-hydrolase [Fragilariopsis cylindrus CCMP1102]|eukprot:OEU12717.1 alpha/beta-hydrolase [Fragilariopsis cylindrus CCMP1102]
MKIVVINATVLLVAIIISCPFLATTAQQQQDADSTSTLKEEFESSTSTGNNDDGSMNRGPNAAGISFSTRFCQTKVHQDAINYSYDAVDQPLPLNTTSSSSSSSSSKIDGNSDDEDSNSDNFRYSYEGVQIFEIDAGIVTPMWTDLTTGMERGQALLLIPDTFNEERKNGPRILYIHGGSWTSCSPTTCGYATFVSKLAKLYNMPILSIDYTLVGSEGNGTFSTILAQTGRAVHFLATNDPLDIMSHHDNDDNDNDDDNHTTRYNATTTTTIDKQEQQQPAIFIMGDSSGGGTAISALVAQASPEGLPESNGAKITAGQTFSPWINLASNSPTYFSQLFGVHHDDENETENDKDDVLLGDINFGWVFGGGNFSTLVQESYDGGAEYSPQNINDPVASPLLNAPVSWLKDLPPLSMHVGMAEVLASDSALFATAVARAGGRWIENHAYDGMWHVFQQYANGCGSNETVVLAESSLQFSKKFIEEVLSSTSTSSTTVVYDEANDKDESNNDDDDDDTTSTSSSYNNNLFCTMNHYEYPTGSDSMAGMTCRPRERTSIDPTTHTTISISKNAISSDATTRTNVHSIGLVVGCGAIGGLLYSYLLI